MNILVSTTKYWNSGDSFIEMGVMKLFEEVWGKNHRYFLWNRNPDVRNLSGVGNYLSKDELSHIDLVLIAGSPDWYGSSYKKLFPFILKKNLPLVAIGIGSPFTDIQLTDLDNQLYNRDNTFVIARDYNVQRLVDKAIVLPCPALFCCDEPSTLKEEPSTLKEGEYFIVQTNKTSNQNSSIDMSHLKNDSNVITFYKDEAIEFPNSYYHYEPKTVLEKINSCAKITSTRLHGAIAAISCLTPAVLVCSRDNTRIVEAQKLFGSILPLINDISENVILHTVEEIKQFKVTTHKKYIETLNCFKRQL